MHWCMCHISTSSTLPLGHLRLGWLDADTVRPRPRPCRHSLQASLQVLPSQIRLWWICTLYQQRHFLYSGCFFWILSLNFFQQYLYMLWVEVWISSFYADIWKLWSGCAWGEPILGPLPRTISLVSNGSNLSLQRTSSIGRPYPPGLGWTPQVTPHEGLESGGFEVLLHSFRKKNPLPLFHFGQVCSASCPLASLRRPS